MKIYEHVKLRKNKTHNIEKSETNSSNMNYIFDELYTLNESYNNLIENKDTEDDNISYFENESGYFYFIDKSDKKSHK